MRINSNIDKIQDELDDEKEIKVYLSSMLNSIKEKFSRKNEKNIKEVINYLNDSNKLPNINKEIDVEFRGFSTEEVEKRKKDNKKGIYNRDGVCAYDLNTGKITIDESKIAEYSKTYNIKENDLLNYMFLHELGHAIHNEWSLDNKGKVVDLKNKQDEDFINSIMKVEGFSGMHTKELNNLHSSVLEGYADLYACTMIREIYGNSNNHKEGEEIIKKIEEIRQKELNLSESYNKNTIDKTLENKYGYDVVDNIKQQTELYHKNGGKNYKDFDELNESIMKINTDIALEKFDRNLEKYTHEINQSQKNDLNYISGFIKTRTSSKAENAGELFSNRLPPGKEIDFKIDISNGYFNQGKKHALSEGVNKDNFKMSPVKVPSRPSLNDNRYNAPANTKLSNVKRPTLNSNRQDYSNQNNIPVKKPKLSSNIPSVPENPSTVARPSLNSKNEIFKNTENLSSKLKKDEMNNEKPGIVLGKHKI